MGRYLLLICLLFGIFSYSQEESEEVELRDFKATVVNAQSEAPMESVHIVNLNQVIGTITNEDGEFTIRAAVNDTLYFSFLGFKSQKIRITNDMFKFKDTKFP